MHPGLNIMGTLKHKQSMFFWTDIIRIDARNEGLYYFASSFPSIVYSIINSSLAPALLPKVQYFLQVSKDVKVGYWFSFQDHVEIRLYGAEFEPYRSPNFVPMMMFSLEFIR